MISYLKGKVIYKEEKLIILLVGGVGYNVFLGNNFLNKIKINTEIEIFTYLHRREDILALYGFRKKTELDFFNQLISVSGVGPKSALHLLDLLGVVEIQRAIANNRVDVLTKAPGLGKKGAERIIVELKSKNLIFVGQKNKHTNEDDDVVSALVGLGYTLSDARQVVISLPQNIKGVDNRIKEALKNIGRKK